MRAVSSKCKPILLFENVLFLISLELAVNSTDRPTILFLEIKLLSILLLMA